MLKIDKKIPNALGRAGVLTTSHGEIKTPAFATVATKATVKALSPEQVREAGSQVILANAYHLYLQPGEKIVEKNGGIHKFSNWQGPIITDSGGFQVFSLGAALDRSISKISKKSLEKEIVRGKNPVKKKLVTISEDGVTFKNPTDGSVHHFTPERSIEIQHGLGADIIFTFDECTSPLAPFDYQKEALERTYKWARRSAHFHKHGSQGKLMRFARDLLKSKEEGKPFKQHLFGIVQGGRFENLRKESAKQIAEIGFDGFGIGGSFEKEDVNTVLKWVNNILPEEKPRHLLGIGEPLDILHAVENGIDLFDCVMPTRIGRNGTIYTKIGKTNITNSKYKTDFSKVEEGCGCYACQNYTKAYLCHLFRAHEMSAATLASIHNIHFINNLMEKIRKSVLSGNFYKFKEEFLRQYKQM